MNVHLVMFDCTALRQVYTIIRKEFKITVRSWLTMLKQLLGLRKATRAVLKSLATSGAGVMPHIQYKEQQEKSRGLNEA